MPAPAIRAARARTTGDKEFVIVGSQSLHGAYPDIADDIVRSAEVDLIAARYVDRTEWLNAIGQDSTFHDTFGYYADPVDERTSLLPRGWRLRLVALQPGDTEGVRGLCLDPHDLAIWKYVAGREKDFLFNRELIARGLLEKARLLKLLDDTPVDVSVRERIAAFIERDFDRGSTPGLP